MHHGLWQSLLIKYRPMAYYTGGGKGPNKQANKHTNERAKKEDSANKQNKKKGSKNKTQKQQTSKQIDHGHMPSLPSIGLTRAFMACGTAATTATQQKRWQLPSQQTSRSEEVLTFWFGSGWKENPPRVTPNYDLWFGGSPETDAEIQNKFGDDVLKAKSGEYNGWISAGPMEALALIILLDQFALNVFREKPEGYQTSEQAIPVAYTAIARGYPKGALAGGLASSHSSTEDVVSLPTSIRMFFYLPLMHSELLQDQEACVRLYGEMERDAGEGEGELTGFAIQHRDVVAQYGRFPGRNKCMGRVTTPEEQKYLDDGGIF